MNAYTQENGSDELLRMMDLSPQTHHSGYTSAIGRRGC